MSLVPGLAARKRTLVLLNIASVVERADEQVDTLLNQFLHKSLQSALCLCISTQPLGALLHSMPQHRSLLKCSEETDWCKAGSMHTLPGADLRVLWLTSCKMAS